jgi:hypothetical protein
MLTLNAHSNILKDVKAQYDYLTVQYSNFFISVRNWEMIILYAILGILLFCIGTALALVFYFLLPSIPLTATGIYAVILGLTSIFLAFTIPENNSEIRSSKPFSLPLLSQALGLAIVNLVLILLNQNDLAIYFIFNSIVYIVITLFFTALYNKNIGALNKMSAIIFVGFLVIMSFKVNDLLK